MGPTRGRGLTDMCGDRESHCWVSALNSRALSVARPSSDITQPIILLVVLTVFAAIFTLHHTVWFSTCGLAPATYSYMSSLLLRRHSSFYWSKRRNLTGCLDAACMRPFSLKLTFIALFLFGRQ